MKYVIGPVPGLPTSPNKRRHWAQVYKENQEWKRSVGLLSLAIRQRHRLEPFKKAAIHYHISVGDSLQHDPDNLAWAVTKPTLDSLKGVLIENDTIDHITLSYSFDRAKPRQFTIEVTPL